MQLQRSNRGSIEVLQTLIKAPSSVSLSPIQLVGSILEAQARSYIKLEAMLFI